MRRDPRTFLWDVREAASAILQFVGGRGFAEYQGDLMLRSAVERQFEIIGEALNQLAKVAPTLASRIPELRNAVGLRNILIHGYDRIEDWVVWQAVKEDLPGLRARAEELLRGLGEAP